MQHIPVRHLPEPVQTESFSIRDVAAILNCRDAFHDLHRHDHFHILALQAGSGRHVIDFKTYPLTAGSVFVIRPGQVHELALKADCKGYLLQFSPSYYLSQGQAPDAQLRVAASRNYYQFDADGMEVLQAALRVVFNEYKAKEHRYEEMIRAQMSIFLIGLIREGRRNPVDAASLHLQERLEKFLMLIEQHIHTHKQATQYAEMMNLSPYQLNAITKTAMGKTSSELINEQIILEARRYLLATSNQVTQIAYHLGYEDVSYFIRFFKKHTGYSPDAFRHHFQLSAV
jgi:AraC family transcriptional regulator, transcriptional activator of pobA